MVRPVDAVIRDFVAKPARAAGFRRKSRNFVLEGASGDQVGFGFQGSAVQYGNAEFFFGFSLWPKAWANYLHARGRADAFNPIIGLGQERFLAPPELREADEADHQRFVIELDEATYARK